MREFEFEFETVLQVRELNEQRRQAELADAEQELSRIRDYIGNLEEKYKNAQNEMRTLQSGTLSIEYIRVVKNRLNSLMQEIGERLDEYKEQLNEVREKRRKLVEASRKKRAMEILKEQEWEDYLKEYYKEEQEFLDDITQSREFGIGKLTEES